jgi:hypothetical protein
MSNRRGKATAISFDRHPSRLTAETANDAEKETKTGPETVQGAAGPATQKNTALHEPARILQGGMRRGRP